MLWSIVANWGGKVSTFLLTVILARLLSPEEFGIASAAALALMVVPLVAEMGFSDAIMQRRALQPSDLNLPFSIAIAVAIVMIAAVILLREPISDWAGLAEHSDYLAVISVTILISVPNAFQEAMYKRNMRFRDLALRSFAASIIGGVAALTAAMLGLGIWAFAVQAYVALTINVVWIWARPQWLPSRKMDVGALFQMMRFGLPVMGQRVTDFAGTRALDFVIISHIGIAGYGIYVVGSRVYLTMMQLLQGAFYDVSLTVLSGLAHERERIADVFRRTTTLAASALSPVFVLLSALSPELCTVVFGNSWIGVDKVAGPLLLLGAVQCVQYMNGAFLSARGRPELILITGITKSALQVAAVLLLPAASVADLTVNYVLAALAVAPLSFFMVSRELGMPLYGVFRLFPMPVLLSGASFLAVYLSRPLIAQHGFHIFWQGCLLGIIFLGCYTLFLSIFDRARARILVEEAGFHLRSLAKKQS